MTATVNPRRRMVPVTADSSRPVAARAVMSSSAYRASAFNISSRGWVRPSCHGRKEAASAIDSRNAITERTCRGRTPATAGVLMTNALSGKASRSSEEVGELGDQDGFRLRPDDGLDDRTVDKNLQHRD